MKTLFDLFGFPSPYGVSFILINYSKRVGRILIYWKFPSPYGVSFILIIERKKMIEEEDIYMFPSPYGVSFILIYYNTIELRIFNTTGFRLLTEYRSFLYVKFRTFT